MCLRAAFLALFACLVYGAASLPGKVIPSNPLQDSFIKLEQAEQLRQQRKTRSTRCQDGGKNEKCHQMSPSFKIRTLRTMDEIAVLALRAARFARVFARKVRIDP